MFSKFALWTSNISIIQIIVRNENSQESALEHTTKILKNEVYK